MSGVPPGQGRALALILALAGLATGGLLGGLWLQGRAAPDRQEALAEPLRCTRIVRAPDAPPELSGRVVICHEDAGGAVGFRLDGGLAGGPVRPDQAWTLVQTRDDLLVVPGAPEVGPDGEGRWPGRLLGVVQGSVQWGPGQLAREEAEGRWEPVRPREPRRPRTRVTPRAPEAP
jgi:hypothetical protein